MLIVKVNRNIEYKLCTWSFIKLGIFEIRALKKVFYLLSSLPYSFFKSLRVAQDAPSPVNFWSPIQMFPKFHNCLVSAHLELSSTLTSMVKSWIVFKPLFKFIITLISNLEVSSFGNCLNPINFTRKLSVLVPKE